MDVFPDEQEILIQQTVRQFLEQECTPALARAAEKNPLKYSPELWKQMAELGWLGLCLPEQFGGQGLSLSYLGLLLEELGRYVAPLPLHSVLVPAIVIARHGHTALQELLPDVVSGERLLSYAVQDETGRWNAECQGLIGQYRGDDIVLRGARGFVDNFAISHHCLVAFRLTISNGSSIPALALVDTNLPGITMQALVTTAKDGQSLVRFDDVRIPASRLLIMEGDSSAALRELLDFASVFMAAQMAGAARRAMEFAVEYAKLRVAFGQPIGAFQAIQHLCADMVIAVDGCDLLIHEAVWRIDQGMPAGVEVSQAKSFANEKCLMVCRSAQQIHGGIGFMMEFDLHLWYRRVAAWALRCGTIGEHRARVASALLDRPGKVRLGATLEIVIDP